MSTNLTQYRVMQNDVEVCRGNLRQCWLWVFNTYPEAYVSQLVDAGITIERRVK